MRSKFVFMLFLVIIEQTNILYGISEEDLPNEEQVIDYVENLLVNYKGFMLKNDEFNNPSFNENKKFFSLYSDTGYSFKITVIKQEMSLDEGLILLFGKIQSNNIEIELKYNTSLTELTGGMLNLSCCYKGVIWDNLIQYLYTFNYDNGLAVYTTDILTEPLKNSNLFAQELYEWDQKKIEQYYDDIRKDEIFKLWNPYKSKNFNETLLWKDYANVQMGYYNNGTYVITNNNNVELTYNIGILKQVQEIEWKIENRKDYEIEKYSVDEKKIDALLHPIRTFIKKIKWVISSIIVIIILILVFLKKGMDYEATLIWTRKKLIQIWLKLTQIFIKKANKVSGENPKK